MARMRGVRRLLRLQAERSDVGDEVDAEIAFHLESRAAELRAGGMAADAARQQAEREFGDVVVARTQLASLTRRRRRVERRAAWWDAVGQELRLAARGLRRAPGFTVTVVLVLALGIGVNAAMFGLTDRLLLSAPPHVRAADSLVRVMYQHTPSWEGVLRVEYTMPYADYAVQRAEVSAFAEVAAYSPPSEVV